MKNAPTRWTVTLPALLAAGCGEVYFTKVIVRDPGSRAVLATELVVTATVGAAERHLALRERDFPVSFALTSEVPARGPLLVLAKRAEVVFARGRTEVVLASEYEEVTVDLAEECSSDEMCQDDNFCNGEERCIDGACLPGPTPCPKLDPTCYAVTCVSARRACLVAPVIDTYDGNACTIDGCKDGTPFFVPAPNGTPCPSGVCSNGTCS